MNAGARHDRKKVVRVVHKVWGAWYKFVATDSPGINFQKMALVLTSPRITVS